MNNYIYAYYQKIKDGEAVVGEWVRLVFEKLVHGIERGNYGFNPKKANRAIRFIESFCHHSKGRTDLIKLELWQKAIISAIFGIVDCDDVRFFREVVIIVSRKQGKSLFAAAISKYMAYLDGEYGAEVYFLAPKLEQANIVFDGFYQSMLMEPELRSISRKRRTDIYIASSNTTVKPIAFNAKKSDGFNPHLVVCDEIASWVGDPGLKQYEVMKSALGARRQPLLLSISTAGYINDSIYDELIKRSTSFLKGNSRESRLLPFLYMIDDIEKWNDINELRKSNPNLGVSVPVDFLLEEIAIAEGSLSKKAEFLTKYCNIKQNSAVAWLDWQDVSSVCGDELSLESFRNSYCVGGIDLSQTTDLTACCALIEKGGNLFAICHFFMPSERLEKAIAEDGVPYNIFIQRGVLSLSGENYVDYHDVFNWYRRLVEEYEIYPLKVGYDRYSAQYLVEEMKQYGFHMDDVYQGENLTPVIREFEGVLKDKSINFGENELLKGHLLNVALKHNLETRKFRPVKIDQRSRIDGFVAVIDAMTVRQKWFGEIGEQLKNAT